jgi:hypothetical protein
MELIRFRPRNDKEGEIFSWLLWFSSGPGMPEGSGIRAGENLGAGSVDSRIVTGYRAEDAVPWLNAE